MAFAPLALSVLEVLSTVSRTSEATSVEVYPGSRPTYLVTAFTDSGFLPSPTGALSPSWHPAEAPVVSGLAEPFEPRMLGLRGVRPHRGAAERRGGRECGRECLQRPLEGAGTTALTFV